MMFSQQTTVPLELSCVVTGKRHDTFVTYLDAPRMAVDSAVVVKNRISSIGVLKGDCGTMVSIIQHYNANWNSNHLK